MVGLLAFNGRGAAPYSHGSAEATYRFSFGCIAVLIAWMAYYRTWRMKPVAGPKVKPDKQADKVCIIHSLLNATLILLLKMLCCSAGIVCVMRWKLPSRWTRQVVTSQANCYCLPLLWPLPLRLQVLPSCHLCTIPYTVTAWV